MTKKLPADFSSDSSTLEYLTNSNRELTDVDEFDDPFSSEANQSIPPSSAQLCARAVHSRNLTYQVAAANVEDILGVALENATKKIERKKLSDGSLQQYLSENLHSSIVLASVNGTDTDALFCRYATNDISKFLKMTKDLTSNHMFSQIPSHSEVKALLTGKSPPELKWVQYPVACYKLLLARIEVSMWAAFYACGGTVESPETKLLSGSLGKENNPVSVTSKQDRGIDIKKGGAVSQPILPLSSLSQSPLLRLHSAAAMLTLGCVVEELKLFWTRLSDRSKSDLLSDAPHMLAHHADLQRCYLRSDAAVDRAVLCPFDWAIQHDSCSHSQLMLDRLKALRADAAMRELLLEESDSSLSLPSRRPSADIADTITGQASVQFTQHGLSQSQTLQERDRVAVANHPTLKFRGAAVAIRTNPREEAVVAPPVTDLAIGTIATQSSSVFNSTPDGSRESFRFRFNHLDPAEDMSHVLRDERQSAVGGVNMPDIEAPPAPAAAKKKRKNKKKKKSAASAGSAAAASIGDSAVDIAGDDEDEDDPLNESSFDEANSSFNADSPSVTNTKLIDEVTSNEGTVPAADVEGKLTEAVSLINLQNAPETPIIPTINVVNSTIEETNESARKILSASDMHGYDDSDMYQIILDGRPLLEDEGGFVTVQHRKGSKQPPPVVHQQPPPSQQQQANSKSKSSDNQDSKVSHSSNAKKKENGKMTSQEKAAPNTKKSSANLKSASVVSAATVSQEKVAKVPSVLLPASATANDTKNTDQPVDSKFVFLGDESLPSAEPFAESAVVSAAVVVNSANSNPSQEPIIAPSTEAAATISSLKTHHPSPATAAAAADVSVDEIEDEDASVATTQVVLGKESGRQSMDFEPFYLESGSTNENPRKGSAAAATAVYANAKSQVHEENTIQLQRRLTKNIRRFNTIMSHRMDVHKMTQVAVLYEVQAIASAIWPRAAVRVFGSSLTGLVLPTSDIDLVIQLSPSDGGESAASQLLSATQDTASILGDTIYSSMASHSLDSEEAPQYPHGRSRSFSVGSEDVSSFAAPNIHARNSSGKVFPASNMPIPFPVISPEVESNSSRRAGSVGDASTSTENMPSQSDVIRCLHAVAAELYSRKWASEVNPIQTASIPVIKLNVKSDILIAAARSNYSHMVAQTQVQQQQPQPPPPAPFSPMPPQPSPVPSRPLSQHQRTPTQYQQGEVSHAPHDFNVPSTVVLNTESMPEQHYQPISHPGSVRGPPSPAPTGQPPSTPLSAPLLESSPNSERSRHRPQMLPHPRPFPIPTPEMDPAIFSMLHQQALEHALKSSVGTGTATPNPSVVPNMSPSSATENTYSLSDLSRQVGLRKSPAANTQIMTIEHSRQMALRKSPAANTTVNATSPRSRYDNRSPSFDNTMMGPSPGVQHALDDSMSASLGSSAAPTPSRPGIAEVGHSIASSTMPPVNFVPPGTPSHHFAGEPSSVLPPPSPHSAAQIQALIPPPRRPMPQAPLNNSIRPLQLSDLPVAANPATFEEYAMLHHQFHGSQFQQQQQQSPHMSPHMQPPLQPMMHPPHGFMPPPPQPPPFAGSRLTSPVQQFGKAMPSRVPHIDTKFDMVSSNTTGEAASGFDLNMSGSSDPRSHYGGHPHDTSGYSLAPDAYPPQGPDHYFRSPSPPPSPYASIAHSHMSSPHTIAPQSPHAYSFHSLSHTPMSSFPPTPRSAGPHGVLPPAYCPDGSLIGGGYGGYPMGPYTAGPPSYAQYGPEQAYMYQQQQQQQPPMHHQQPPFQGQLFTEQPPHPAAPSPSQPPQYQPRTPQASYLPFHQALPQAKGVVIPVDITIEAREHKGISTCDYIQHVLRTQSHAIPSVVKVVKYLLVNASLNVPFNGGLSSYSVFLLVCAAYESLQQEVGSDAPTSDSGKKGRVGVLAESDPSMAASVSSPLNLKKVSRTPVTEGRLLLHFLKMFGRDFNPAVHGVDVPGSNPALFALSPEEQAMVGTSCWVRDPLDPSKNVARPSFMFRQIQETFSQYLTTLERENIKANHYQYSANHALVNGQALHSRGNHFLQNHFLSGSRIPPAQVPSQGHAGSRPGFHNSFYPGMNNSAAQARANKTFQKYNMFNTTRAGNLVNDEPDLLGSLIRYN